MIDTPFLGRIQGIVGAAGLLQGGDTARYEIDHRRLFHGQALGVVRPADTAQLAAVVQACAEARITMVPQGGNTSYCGGATPDASGHQVVISLERMRRVRSLDPTGGTIIAEAGCTLLSVREAAESVGRRFPLSLGSDGSCQIGGNLSTNAGGTQVLRHGMIRDLVLGLEVVLPDGRVLNQLRRLRKDNTGYDVKQLFIGAEGTLGIITAASLRLLPATADSLTALVAVGGLVRHPRFTLAPSVCFRRSCRDLRIHAGRSGRACAEAFPSSCVPLPRPAPGLCVDRFAVTHGAGEPAA